MIVIAGAGIGGLTLGRALDRVGRPFVICERAPELRPAGAGIALSANAFTALAHLDPALEAALRAAGQELGEVVLCDERGRALITTPVRAIVKGGTVAMARTRLQEVLLEGLGARVRTGRAVVGCEPRAGGVRVRLEDGETIDAELLVGADGLRSTVRRALRGEEPLRYAGHTSWRAIVEGFDLEQPERMTESWGAGRRFGIVPIGDRRVYWFAVADAAAGERDAADPRADLRARFAGWHAPIDRLLAETPPERILRTDVCDRPPIDEWVRGAIALLGDAAHPMTPNLGQGGCQAVEDAVVLANALGREPTITAALTVYQQRRLARANRFVVRSHSFGRLAHIKPAPLRWLRNQALRALPLRATLRAAARDLAFELP